MGYYANGWDDKSLATLVDKAGGNSIRPTLPETFVDTWGYKVRLSEFQYYANDLGMKEITCFIEGPSEAHRDKTKYPGASSSKSFANLYEPIWKADGTVNPTNYYATYVYNLVQLYGPYIKNWEVINEPDLGNNKPDEWLTRAPLPSEMENFKAPFFHYIRMLRITWEVVKKYNPEDHVTPGGIGHSTYLDALLRYTDNPNGGAVTSQYPNKGGAYFDMVSYHVYPSFFLRIWDNSIGGFKFLRNSDYAAAQVINHKNGFEAVLQKYGYNGVTYPKKHFIVTETNISRRTSDWRNSSDEMQRNFGIKTMVLAQKNNIKQVHIYGVGENVNAPNTSDVVSGTVEYGLMGLYENLTRDAPGAEKLTQLGKGIKTTSQLLQGYVYDAGQTAALKLPAGIEGGAFRKEGETVYVLWAKNPNDKTESYSLPFSFPSALNISKIDRFEWDYAVSGNKTQPQPTGLTINTTPSFFKVATGSVVKQNQTITFNSIEPKVFEGEPSSFDLQATSTSGLTVEFKVVSGAATVNGKSLTVSGPGHVTVEASQGGNSTYNAAAEVSQSFEVTSGASTSPTSTFRIEAEEYTRMSGVQTENTADTGGGLNVGYTDNDDWMNYTVPVSAAGQYTMSFRVAAQSKGAKLEVKNANGKVLATVDVPETGEWQRWQTVSASITLDAGTQTLQLYAKKGGWNINWFEVTGSASVAPTAPTDYKSIPGLIQAEAYSAMSGMQKENTDDTGGGQNLGYVDDGDWADYKVSAASNGAYTFSLRVASHSGSSVIEVKNAGGAVLGSVTVPATGDWQSYTTVKVAVNLNAGDQTIRLYAKEGGWNLNWFEATAGAVAPVPAVITFPVLSNRTVGDAPFELSASSTNTQVPIAYSSSNPAIVAVAEVSGKWRASILKAGTVTITATQAAGAGFLAAESLSRTLTVAPAKDPTPAPANAITVQVKFDSAPRSASSSFADMKYDKSVGFLFVADDAHLANYNLVYKVLHGGTAVDGKTYPGVTYTDGAGNQVGYKWSFAVNGRGDEPGSAYTQYPQLAEMIAEGFDVMNHTRSHGGSHRYQEVKELEKEIFQHTGYRTRTGVIPTADEGFVSSWIQEGYKFIGSTFGVAASRDGYDAYVNWSDRVSIKNMKTDYLLVSRFNMDDMWKADLGSADSWVDNIFAAATQGNKIMGHAFSHGPGGASQVKYFQQFVHYVKDHPSNRDRAWIAGTQEFAEYYETKESVVKSEELSGNTLTITLDLSKVSDRNRLRDMSLLVDSDRNIHSVTVTGADDFSYNPATGLVNVFKQNRNVASPFNDPTPPQITSVEANGKKLTITYDKSVNQSGTGGYEIDGNEVTGIEGSGTQWTLTLRNNWNDGQRFTYRMHLGNATGNGLKVTSYIDHPITKKNSKQQQSEGMEADSSLKAQSAKSSVSADSSLNGETLEDSWSVYPNPVRDKVQLQIGRPIMGELTVDVLNASGKVVRSIILNKTAGEILQTVSLQNLANGLYFIRLRANGLEEVKKVIKQL
ncbi:carbohydrate-binding protein [Rufibacter sp. XAAS-G3-1]|uniref:carbohydrate-binding protein n=1 Tax=Rufibacter sp. XAAS-G3-1 TaxID=2729134 RepID=UPI0015E67670|nr:carbohydrate-binding protein [Rufibacter sp. XAAS-G3-1]